MKHTEDIQRIVDYFKGREEVSSLFIFGSAASGEMMPESDIDLAVLINDRRKGRISYDSLRKKYYAVSPKFSMRNVDITILNTAPPFLKHRIIKTGKVLFDKNRRMRVIFAARAVLEYFDYKPIEDACLKAVTGRFRRSSVGR